MDDVKSGGIKSLIAQALRLGDIKTEDDPVVLDEKAMKEAFDNLPEEDKQVLLRTKVRCRRRRAYAVGLGASYIMKYTSSFDFLLRAGRVGRSWADASVLRENVDVLSD